MKNPSLSSVACYALLLALIGALSCFTLLASVSPEPFSSVADYEKSLEENESSGILNAHYFEGPTPKAADWTIKRKILLNANDTTLELTDSEINAWVVAKMSPVLEPLSEEEEVKSALVPGLPNFFVNGFESSIHFSIPLQISVMGRKADYLLIGKGTFAKENPTLFQLSKLRLNEAAIPFPAKLTDPLLVYLLKPLYESEEFAQLKKAWEKVDSVEWIESGLRLNLN